MIFLDRPPARAMLTVVLYTATEAIHTYQAQRETLENAGHPWGCEWLDQLVGSNLPGTLTVVGAESNIGKSFFMLMLAHGLYKQGGNVLYVSLEDTVYELGRRLSLYESLSPQGPVGTFQVYAPDSPRLSLVEAVVGKVPNISTLYVDYLQVSVWDRLEERPWSRADEVSRTVRVLKELGRMYAVPVVLASQLRRPMAGEARTPSMRRLKESGDIENQAEYVILLDRDECGVVAELAKSKTTAVGARRSFAAQAGGVLRCG